MTVKPGGIEMNRRRWLLLILITALTACEPSKNTSDSLLIEMGSTEDCDAAGQTCTLSNGDLVMKFALEKDVRVLKPFKLDVQIASTEQLETEEVIVEFFMEGMEMGVNRYRLIRGKESWQGDITLPVCMVGRSDWRAVVEAKGNGKRYRGTFRFHSSG